MASSPNGADELFDQFLTNRGHDVESVGWERDRSKLQCPDCGGLHGPSATSCSVCGWEPQV